MEPMFKITHFIPGQSLLPANPEDPASKPWSADGGNLSPSLDQFTILQSSAVVELGPGVASWQRQFWYSATLVLKGQGPDTIHNPNQSIVNLLMDTRGFAHLEEHVSAKITMHVGDVSYSHTFSGPRDESFTWSIKHPLSIELVRRQEIVLLPMIVSAKIVTNDLFRSGFLDWSTLDGAIDKAIPKVEENPACDRFSKARKAYFTAKESQKKP